MKNKKPEGNIALFYTRVRQAMSDAYVSVSKEKRKIMEEYEKTITKLRDGKKRISYDDYITYQQYADNLLKEIKEKNIEMSTWEKAIDICLSTADEVNKNSSKGIKSNE